MKPVTVFAESDLPFYDAHWNRLSEIAPEVAFCLVDPADAGAVSAALETAEIALLSSDLDDRHVQAPRLKWVHCNHAGLTRSCRPEAFARGLIVTGAAGRSGPALAEHVIMFALMLSSGYQKFFQAQQRGIWLPNATAPDARALAGQTIGILGMGHTGLALARRAQAFGMHVLGYRRRDAPCPSDVDKMFSADRGDSIEPILRQADIVVLALNLSDATYHLIDAKALRMMRSEAVIINMARGEVIDQDALISALCDGQIAGAGLDVTTPEPLPANHPLWHAPNTLITPHSTAPLPDKTERAFAILLENFQRYRAGDALLNQVTMEDVWSQ